MNRTLIRRMGFALSAAGLVLLGMGLIPAIVEGIANRLAPDGQVGVIALRQTRTGLLLTGGAGMAAGCLFAFLAGRLAAFAFRLDAEFREARQSAGALLHGRRHRAELAVLAAVFAAGGAARLAWINSPIRLDEAISFMNFARLGGVYSATHYHTNSHVLNTLLMAGSTRLFGEAEWALRLPSFAFGLAVMPLTFLFFRRLAGAPAALLAMACVAAAPGMVEFGFLARGYSIQTAMFLGLLLSVHRLALRGGAWAMTGTAILPALMMYTLLPSVYAIAVAAAWGLFLAVRVRGVAAARPIVLAGLASVILTLVLYAPLVLVSGVAAVTDNYYVQPQPVSVVIQRFPLSLIQTWNGWIRGMPVWLFAPLLILFLAGAWRLRMRSPWWAALVVIPPLLLLQRIVPYPRTWLFLLPVFAGTAAAGLAGLLRYPAAGRGLLLTLALGIAGGGLVWNGGSQAIENSPESSGWPDDRPVARELARRGITLSDRVVSNSVCTRLHYYFRRLGLPHDAIDLPPDAQTRRVFFVRTPIGVEWRISDALDDFQRELGEETIVADFSHGTRLTVAERRMAPSP